MLLIALQGGSLALVVVLALAAIRGTHGVGRKLWMGFSLGNLAFIVQSLQTKSFGFALPGRALLGLTAASSLFWFWLLVRTFFEDDFRVRPLHFLWLLVLCLPVWVRVLARSGGHSPAVSDGAIRNWLLLPSFLLLADLVFRLIRGVPEDLMESRRIARFALVSFAALLVLANLIFRMVRHDQPLADVDRVILQSAYLLVQISGLFLFFSIQADWVRPETEPPRQVTPADDEDRRLESRVRSAMEVDKVYLVVGLSLADLARRLRVPEHRLRRVINQRMGFRNFPEFLNSWRIAAARERLGDQAFDHLPILSVALDLGFGSIGTFNRAFKMETGQTPTQFRGQHQAGRNLENLSKD